MSFLNVLEKIYLLTIVSNQSWKEVPLLEISCQTNCVNYYYCTKGGERDTTAFTDFKEHSYPCLYMTAFTCTNHYPAPVMVNIE